MSERDSARSSDNNAGTGSKPVDPASTTPGSHGQNEDTGRGSHGYFVPLLLVIVLGIVFVAGFEDELKNMAAMVQLAGSGDEPRPVLAAKPAEITDSGIPAVSTAANPPVIATTPGGAATVETASATTVETDPLPTPLQGEASDTTIASTLSPATDNTASQHAQASNAVSHNRPAQISATAQSTTAVDHYTGYRDMRQQQQKAYEDTLQARRTYRQKMREYRIAVLKRIEQDRRDMHRQMREYHRGYQIRREAMTDNNSRENLRTISHPI